MIFRQHQSDLSGLILPGGESTTMGKLLRDQQMLIPIREAILIWTYQSLELVRA